MEEKERYEIHIYDDICVDLYDNGVLDISINDTYKLEELLNQQDKRIKELEEELAKQKEKYDKLYGCYKKTSNEDLYDKYRLAEETQQLKQQLHDLPKKIVKEITNELSNNTSLYFEMRESTSAHCPNKEYEWFNYVRFRNYINAILKKFGAEDESNND